MPAWMVVAIAFAGVGLYVFTIRRWPPSRASDADRVDDRTTRNLARGVIALSTGFEEQSDRLDQLEARVTLLEEIVKRRPAQHNDGGNDG